MKLHTLLLSGLLAFSTVLSAASISIVPASGTVSTGGTVALDIVVTDVTDLYVWQLDLLFDPSAFQATGADPGPIFGSTGNFYAGDIDNTAGTVTFVMDMLNGDVPGFTGGGLLTTIYLTAGAVGGPFAFDLLNVWAADSMFGDIVFDGINGASVSITDGSGVVVPEPSTFALTALGLAAAVFAARRARRA